MQPPSRKPESTAPPLDAPGPVCYPRLPAHPEQGRSVSQAVKPPRRLLLSALTNWLAFAATLLVSFFLTPYLVRCLGKESYGVWGFVESILAYFTLFDLGI